jgi:hypothetical protein
MKRQVIGWNERDFWVSHGYAPLRVAWSDVRAVFTRVAAYPTLRVDLFGVEYNDNDVLELHSDALNLAAFRSEVYRRFEISPDDQARLEPGETHLVSLSPGSAPKLRA